MIRSLAGRVSFNSGALTRRPAAQAARGQYFATDCNSDDPPHRLLCISDMFQVGSWALMHKLWALMLRQREVHEQFPGWNGPNCCEVYVMAALVYKMGVRQAPDGELAPTLPPASAYDAALVARHPWSQTARKSRDGWLSDVPRGGAICSRSGFAAVPPCSQVPPGSAVNEFCAPPGTDLVPLPAAARNDSAVWLSARPDVNRPHPELYDPLWRIGLRASEVDWHERLHPYVAPMYRLKSGVALIVKDSSEGPSY